MADFCAICTEESADLCARPLGRGRALVKVCADCDEEHPRSGRYAFGESERGSMPSTNTRHFRGKARHAG